jgi:hypothetical protein
MARTKQTAGKATGGKALTIKIPPRRELLLAKKLSRAQPIRKIQTLVCNLATSTWSLTRLSSVFSARMADCCTSAMSALVQHAQSASVSLMRTRRQSQKTVPSFSASRVTG